MALARGRLLWMASLILGFAFARSAWSEEAPAPAPVEPPKAEPAPVAPVEAPKAAEPAPEAPKHVEPVPEAPKAAEPAPVAPAEAPKAEEPKPAAEAPKAEPIPVPEAKVRTADARVVVDGVSYTWEEAVRKWPEMRAKAPANLVLDPNDKSSGKSEPAVVAEKPAKQNEPKPAKQKKVKQKKGEPAVVLNPVVEPTAEYAEQVAMQQARERLALEEKIRKNVRRLTTAGWKDAQKELVEDGREAVPFLIEALGVSDEPKDGEYPLDTYTLTSAGRPTYTRPLKDVAFEVLDNMVRNHSNWKGAVPARDQQAWQEFWAAGGAAIAFGK